MIEVSINEYLTVYVASLEINRLANQVHERSLFSRRQSGGLLSRRDNNTKKN